jgi:hypothetical protein
MKSTDRSLDLSVDFPTLEKNSSESPVIASPDFIEDEVIPTV